MNDSELVSKLVEQHFGVARAGESIAAAWQVVAKMRSADWNVSVKSNLVSGEWEVEMDHWEHGTGFAIADTAPLAICLAALCAVGVEVPEDD